MLLSVPHETRAPLSGGKYVVSLFLKKKNKHKRETPGHDDCSVHASCRTVICHWKRPGKKKKSGRSCSR